MNLKLIALAMCVTVFSACTPEEVRTFRSITGGGPATVEEAHSICAEAFGPKSVEDGGKCEQVAIKIVAEELSTPKPPGYRSFTSCRDAVDYLFAGRSDIQRARKVVHRESTDNPNAVSRTGHRGCAQLSSTLRSTFLGGAWNDPYWNVLAMQHAVDDPKWGWCHWDIVNYCSPGGDF